MYGEGGAELSSPRLLDPSVSALATRIPIYCGPNGPKWSSSQRGTGEVGIQLLLREALLMVG